MILRMEKLSVAGLLDERESVIRELMRGQCIQMRPPDEMEGYEQVEQQTVGGQTASYEVEQKLSRYSTALGSVGPYLPKRGLLTPREQVQYDKLEDNAILAKADGICAEIERITAEIAESRAEKAKDQFIRASLGPWLENDLPLELSGTDKTSIIYYLLPPKTDVEQIKELKASQAPACVLEVISADKEQIYLLAVCHHSDEDALWEILKGVGATKMAFGSLSGTAKENLGLLEKNIIAADTKISSAEEELKNIGAQAFPLQYGFDALSVKVAREKTGALLRTTEKTFCFTAWVPETRKETAIKVLESHGCHYEFAESGEGDEPPILLKNSRMATPYEAVVNMYSPPAYGSFDPNGFVSITYFIIFGMMLGDAGFGLILFLGGLFLGRKMDLSPGGKGILKVITWGGLSTTIWGFVYGSFFGDTLQVVSGFFFGNEIAFPQMINPITDAMTVMGICLGLGLVHIFMGMGIKFYILVKRGKVLDAIFDVGLWYVFIIGLLLLLGGTIFEGIGGIGMVMSIVGAVGLVLTQGRHHKNPAMKLFGGIGKLYDISGYLSDVLSYSRILALGLATGVIAEVFNIIGTLLGGGVFGFIFWLIIFAIGSAMNLGINTLGSYVHTARLHYVEFFGRFYETGGKLFAPLSAQTKYILVTNKEDI